MIVSRFIGLTETDAESIEMDVDQWLDSLAIEPGSHFCGQMFHPGWSPVAYDPPKRGLANVRRVYALVLDHDKGGDWDALVQLWSGVSGVVYTTKSHAANAAHYRVVLALSRPVDAGEYSKIWLWAAKRSGDAAVEVDQQCKDASRFWYDPTMPPGGWRAQRIQGATLDPDPILALTTAAPRLEVVRPRPAPDSSERMRRARAYLAKIPGAVTGQSGHTATFNAACHVMFGFDLGEDDTLSLLASEYNPRCDPPWSERELKHKVASAAQRSKRERGYLLQDRPRIESTRTAASYAPVADLDVDWTSKILVSNEGKTRRAYHNTAVFVRHHPEFRGRWSLDQMTGAPWFNGQMMDTAFIHHVRGRADCVLGYTPTAGDVEAAIIAAAKDRPFHPILQYLRSLDWDGTPRLAAMAHDYFDLDSALHSEMVRKFMIGAAARALWPGCKLDTALMLVGDQGYRKSTFFSVLGGQWHADTHIDITNKDGAMQLHSAWIYELSELENVVTGARESRLKAWMSSSHDLYRAPYAKTTERKPRSVVICGSTNRDRFLTDETGSRRFHILRVSRVIPFELLAEMRDQLWAEAVCAAESGEPWWLEREQESNREIANRDFTEDDSWSDPIGSWLADPRLQRVSVSEVLEQALKIETGRHGRWEQMRVARILVQLGWGRKQIRVQGKQSWFYVRSTQFVE